MKTHGNLFTIPAERPQKDEFVDALAAGKGVHIERIVSHGHTTPPGEWYDQETDEWVVLLDGEATLEWKDGDMTELRKGDWLLIPAHRQHRVAATSDDPPCIWLAVHGDLSTDETG
ncbi:MAG: cupin domain-containing protein [Myxococcota bacterium]